MAKAKGSESVSLEEAAEAFIALYDSGNYNGRRFHRVLGMLRDAVKKDSDFGPIVPDDVRPELDEDQEKVMEELAFIKLRGDDEIHPGSRNQKAREALDTILEQAEAGTLANDGGRELARQAKEAAKTAAKEAEDVQKVAIVPATRTVVSTDAGDDAEKPKKK